jgi:diadenosine tetraphosphate (Ap4A) HIT family hydrolase
MAFLALYPNTEGFTVVVPKEHYGSDVLAMPDDILSRFVLAAKKVSNVLIRHFNDVGRVGLIMEGTGIDHAHIKLSPMHGTDHMKRGEWRQYHGPINTFFETYNGYIASNDGPMADEQQLHDLAERLRRLGE